MAVKGRFWTSDGPATERGKNGRKFFASPRSCRFFHQRGAWNTRQLGFFPLATTPVGWVPDQHTRRAKVKRRTRSAAESCAGGLPTENGAQGEALLLIDTKCRSGFSEVLMLCVTVTGLWVSERRAEAISKIRLCLPGVPQRIGRLLLVGLWSNERLDW